MEDSIAIKTTYKQLRLRSVHTMQAHFENGEKSDGSKIWASVHTIPAQFENGTKFDGKMSLQDFDAKESTSLDPKASENVLFTSLLSVHMMLFQNYAG